MILYDSRRKWLIAARDPIGIRPLFYGYSESGAIAFASEAKNLVGLCKKIYPFPIGSYYCNGKFVRYCDIADTPAYNQDDLPTVLTNIREKLIAGVDKRLDADTPVGFLLSGGLDSCLALLAAVRACRVLGRSPRDIVAITMPCFGTTRRTRSNAELLCEALGVQFVEINIAETVKSHFADIGQQLTDYDVTFENGQARVRTLELMDYANKHGGLVVGTGDLSELALGWATYNGDHMSMYGVNGSVPKTLVRHIVATVAANSEPALREVLQDILDTPVSPELLPARENGEIAQQTEAIVGPYELHDFFLYYAIRWGFAPKKIFWLAQRAFAGVYEDAVLVQWLRNFYRRFFAQQFKRSCLPDGPKVGTVTLSPRGDWRMPSDACADLWLRELDEIKCQ